MDKNQGNRQISKISATMRLERKTEGDLLKVRKVGKEFSAPGVRVGLLQEEEAGCAKVLRREEPGTCKKPKGDLVRLGHTEEGEETGGADWRGSRQSLEGSAKGVSLCLAQKQ